MISKHNKGLKRKNSDTAIRTEKKKLKTVFDENQNGPEKLEKATYSDFCRLLTEHLKSEDENRTTPPVLANTVFEKTVGNEVVYSKNQVVSQLFDGLLPYASESVLGRFTDAFYGDGLREICVHPFASPVLKKLICLAAKKVIDRASGHDSKDGGDGSANHASQCLKFVLNVSNFLLTNLDELSKDTNASHVLCAAVRCLSGSIPTLVMDDTEDEGAKIGATDSTSFSPPEFVSVLCKLGEKILQDTANLKLYTRNVLLSSLLQAVLVSLLTTKKGKKLSLRIVQELLENVFRPPDVNNPKAADTFFNNELNRLANGRLLVAMMDVEKTKVFHKIYFPHYASQLVKIALGKESSFALRKLIVKCDDSALLEKIYSGLSQGDGFKAIIAGGKVAIVLALCQACRRLNSNQSSFVKDLSAALGVQDGDDDQLVMRLVKMAPVYDEIQQKKKRKNSGFFVNLHGCLIIQEMIAFQENGKIIRSLLAVPTSDLVYILSDAKGSRIGDALFKTDGKHDKKIVGKFTEKFKGSWVKLAMSNLGSNTITNLWKNLTVAQKLQVIEELAGEVSRVISTPSGRSIAIDIGLQSRCPEVEKVVQAIARKKSAKISKKESPSLNGKSLNGIRKKRRTKRSSTKKKLAMVSSLKESLTPNAKTTIKISNSNESPVLGQTPANGKGKRKWEKQSSAKKKLAKITNLKKSPISNQKSVNGKHKKGQAKLSLVQMAFNKILNSKESPILNQKSVNVEEKKNEILNSKESPILNQNSVNGVRKKRQRKRSSANKILSLKESPIPNEKVDGKQKKNEISNSKESPISIQTSVNGVRKRRQRKQSSAKKNLAKISNSKESPIPKEKSVNVKRKKGQAKLSSAKT